MNTTVPPRHLIHRSITICSRGFKFNHQSKRKNCSISIEYKICPMSSITSYNLRPSRLKEYRKSSHISKVSQSSLHLKKPSILHSNKNNLTRSKASRDRFFNPWKKSLIVDLPRSRRASSLESIRLKSPTLSPLHSSHFTLIPRVLST